MSTPSLSFSSPGFSLPGIFFPASLLPAFLRLVFLATLFLPTSVLPVFARCEDPNVAITQQAFDNGVRYVAVLKNALEVTVDVDCKKFSNVTASSKTPATFTIAGPGTKEILRFTQRNRNEKWYVGPWMKSWKYGFPSQTKTDPNYIYELPFEKNKQFKVNQSYQGKHSHAQGSESEFSIDFGMPEGTTVCAARAGKVIVIRDDATEGGDNRELYEDCANAVIVRHNDGTYATYLHLKASSATVKLGQNVNAGTPIAQSGNTGWSTTPHLHFSVYRVISGAKLLTVPVKFRTAVGVKARLLEGEFYGAGNNAN